MSRKSKLIVVLVALAVVISAIAGVIYNEFIKIKPIEAKETVSLSQLQPEAGTDIRLIAHRGLSGIAPENTMAAIKAACDAGYYGVEFDILLTSDGEWVVCHDENLKRMTGQKVNVSETELKELQKIYINNGANIDKYEGITISTLREVLEYISTTEVVPVVEIKTQTKDGVDDLVALLKEFDYLDTASIISFHQEPLKEFKRICNRTPMAYLTHDIDDEIISFCLENDIESLSFNHGRAKEDDVKKIVDAGLTPQAWTVDSTEKLMEFYSYSVKYFTTNCILP